MITALWRAGYGQISFYYAPRGFALVTRLEQIDDEGAPLSGDNRWREDPVVGMRDFSLAEYLRVLFTAPKGRYRILVFAVTSEVFSPKPVLVDRETASLWLSFGAPFLPHVYDQIPFSDDYRIVCLIYEFLAHDRKAPPVLVEQGIPADRQLAKTRLWDLASLEGGHHD
jgi:hypothetical protein